MEETRKDTKEPNPYAVQQLRSAKTKATPPAGSQPLTHEEQLKIAVRQLRTHEQQLEAANQRLKVAVQQLRAREQQLDAANQQLKAHEQQLETSNQKLLVSNQQLRAREQQLDAANQQLRAHEQQLETANQQLKAINIQLQSREQQLNAANQQLRAHEQQLETANQQLKAINIQLQSREQQLDAANQQLRAHEQQLETANQQLKSVNQQLRAHEQQLDSSTRQLRAEIADHKETEKKLLFRTTLLEAQSEATIDGILVVDAEGNSILFNKRFGQMWDIPQHILDTKNDEQMLQYILTKLKDPDAFLARVKDLYTHKDEKSRDEIEFKDGRFFDRYSSPMIDINGKYYGRIWYFRDITEAKRAEKHLKEAKDAAELANKAKSQFLANMSHEIRTPLNTIISISKILHKSDIDNLTAKQREGCEIIYKSAQRLLALINDILDLSKIESGKMELQLKPFSLDAQIAAIKSMARTLIGDKKITYSVEKTPSTPDTVISDVHKLHEIITNIVSNAIKFTDKGQINLKVYVQDERLFFHVSDTGIGISQYDLYHIFEEFTQADSSTTREHPGTGLGLAICKKTVELLGGKISAESELEKGTVITFYVPLIAKILSPDIDTAKSADSKTKISQSAVHSSTDSGTDTSIPKPTILIAEDDEFGRAAIKMMLENKYNLIFAENGEKVVEKYFSLSPDIVLMDIMMPVMDGYQAFSEINKKAKKPPVPIIALTAKAMIEDRSQLLDFGFSDYVSKPINDEMLINTIDTLLAKTKRI